MLALLIAGATLLERVLRISGPAEGFVGRPTLITALSLVLISLSCLAATFPKWPWKLFQWPALLAAFIGLTAIMGAAFHVSSVSSLYFSSNVSLQSAFFFIMLALAVILALPQAGLMAVVSGDNAGGQLARRLLPVALVVPIVIALAELTGERMGLYEGGFGDILLALSSLLIFSTLTFRNARQLGETETIDKQLEKQTAVSETLAMAKQQIEQQKNMTDTYLRSIGDGVVAIDREWNITLWNKTAAEITGWNEAEALGKPLRNVVKFIRENDRQENIDFIEHAMVTAKTASLEGKTILLTKDSREIPVGDSAAPIVNSTGKVTGAIIIFRDASSERQSESLKSDFAYASHQLRTPVNEAQVALDVASSQKDLSSAMKWLATAQNSMLSVQKVVEDLIIVSDIDQGRVLPKVQTVSVNKIVDEVVSRAKPKAEVKKVEVQAKLSGELKIQTDPALFKIILSELIDNAVSYSPKLAQVTITISEQKEGLLTEVNNAGDTIPEAEQALIFTKFFRGSNHPIELPGAGLGLFIARSYTELLGGKLFFKSDKNEGTTFSVLLAAKSA